MGTPGPPQPTPPAAPPAAPRPRASIPAVVLATLAVLFTAWAARDLLLPVLLAMFLALLGNPVLRALRRLRIPVFVGAVLLLAAGIALALMLGRQLVAPAAEWMQQLPSELQVLTPKLQQMTGPMQQASEAAASVARAADGGDVRQLEVVAVRERDPWERLVATPKMVMSVLAVVLLTFFFMVYGERLQRHAIALLPHRYQQKLTVQILQAVEHEVSRYVFTITVINALLGVAVAGALYLIGLSLPNALLWGTLVALLNYAPYVGAFMAATGLLLMGLIVWDDIGQALLPVAAYLVLQTLEGQLLTPIVVGQRMALSPLLLVLALMLFGFMWGFIGLLLAVPLLVCTKMVLSRIDGLERWARLLE
ncbi:MAG: AI-2E family transporter [Luteimonas sp.]